MHKADATALSLEQSRKKERALEEEGRRLADELSDSLRVIKELQGDTHWWLRIWNNSCPFAICEFNLPN